MSIVGRSPGIDGEAADGTRYGFRACFILESRELALFYLTPLRGLIAFAYFRGESLAVVFAGVCGFELVTSEEPC